MIFSLPVSFFMTRDRAGQWAKRGADQIKSPQPAGQAKGGATM